MTEARKEVGSRRSPRRSHLEALGKTDGLNGSFSLPETVEQEPNPA